MKKTIKISARFLSGIIIGLTIGCSSNEKNREVMNQDPHSYAVPSEAVVKHLSWKAVIDFSNKTISATARWEISNINNADVIILDTKGLQIEKVWLDDGINTEFKLGEKDEILGQPLAVMIRPGTKHVSIQYKTSSTADALQWLSPEQTAGKTHPFLFTQSQAILARSWVPCQDSPSIRFTYDAEVSAPRELIVLMSASNPTEKSASGKYTFTMQQPIPSYLLALAAGDLEFRSVSARCGIYSEPAVIDTAVWEFADLEKMVAGAEELYGPYQWERYDVLVLPPSFPFGGMENPRVTFATPTILAGDRSLTSLIAHELAHSWSGNLVTNATWNDFWLNEGFTVYFEHRIMEKLYGRDYSEMLAVLSLQDLKVTIDEMQKEQYADTKLLLNLVGRNPDDGVTDIAYNKGYFFLRLIEEKYGREKFDVFLKSYFSEKAFHSMNTEAFLQYIKGFYTQKFSIEIPKQVFDDWIFKEGLPESCPVPVSERFANVEKAGLDKAAASQWSTHEWLHFLKNLPDTLNQEKMVEIDKFGDFTRSGNSEITAEWLVHCIRNNYAPANEKLEYFLINTGRRKFLTPLYTELIKTPEGKKLAQSIYEKARPNYHFVATNTFDKLLR